MTGTLATINGERYAVPGLTFWGKRLGDTRAIICSDERGAVELFERSRSNGELTGGVLLHSPYDWQRFAGPHECSILPGGGCWSDISFLAYDREFRDAIQRGDSETVLREMARWHGEQFGDGAG